MGIVVERLEAEHYYFCNSSGVTPRASASLRIVTEYAVGFFSFSSRQIVSLDTPDRFPNSRIDSACSLRSSFSLCTFTSKAMTAFLQCLPLIRENLQKVPTNYRHNTDTCGIVSLDIKEALARVTPPRARPQKESSVMEEVYPNPQEQVICVTDTTFELDDFRNVTGLTAILECEGCYLIVDYPPKDMDECPRYVLFVSYSYSTIRKFWEELVGTKAPEQIERAR